MPSVLAQSLSKYMSKTAIYFYGGTVKLDHGREFWLLQNLALWKEGDSSLEMRRIAKMRVV